MATSITHPVILSIEGLSDVMYNLSRARGIIGSNIARGLIEAGKYLLKESQWLCPVQIGTLRASGYVRNIGDRGWKADVVVGYTAYYAVFVHEDLTKAHGRAFNLKYGDVIRHMIAKGLSTKESGWFWRRDQEQAKFLEQPCRTQRNMLFGIIHRIASV